MNGALWGIATYATERRPRSMSERDILQEKMNCLEVLLDELNALEADYGMSAELTALREKILEYLARHRDELRDIPDPN
jgi:hypothetical protein